ncbi:transporter substrate-binding domain-containing protein [Mesorhizobium sp. M00.F.Ca.ET.151.01.1.1]|uniref:transporter substrate-binding domain-containing protein n=1 Tax=Stenotrophomonas pavanii TaxID=487698 RepID=UPI000CD12CF6|nr:transporter substrate-binding domain-containing protein [Stenotrophomonas pavanii]TGR53317.1 transporter substrate-binding domain-containing protein [bacterium M00.F.Ca.ET.199.01.1.1]TGT07981.1 transporter substrate-binding domain-containing protein [bacterium M00.F.Ca.ET.177.01.1.1]TGT65228.1 transporter substrate-binding domain-containing protein [Mesorhizobium sp. M00.F.Ca.ET.170.01.1.1]TGU15372.1 transporter substrate-binding domain-containing protein [bacterium M00.F.Ca.ET.163.01.1.1]T
MSLAEHRGALAPLGFLRVAINLGNPVLAQGDARSPRGPSLELATALAQRIGVQARFRCHDAAASVVAAANEDGWDLAFLAIDPARADRIAFSAPYVEIEGTYLVREDSPARQVDDLDHGGLRIAVGRGAAYDLFLSRELRHATIERAETSAAAIRLFAQQRLDAAAGVRQPLAAWAQAHPGHRVLADRFTAIQQAVAAPASRPAEALQALFDEVEAIKAGPLLEAAFARAGQAVTLVR